MKKGTRSSGWLDPPSLEHLCGRSHEHPLPHRVPLIISPGASALTAPPGPLRINSFNWIVAVVVIALLPFLKSASIPGQRMCSPAPTLPSVQQGTWLYLMRSPSAAAAASLPIFRFLNWFFLPLFCFTHNSSLILCCRCVLISIHLTDPPSRTTANPFLGSWRACARMRNEQGLRIRRVVHSGQWTADSTQDRRWWDGTRYRTRVASTCRSIERASCAARRL